MKESVAKVLLPLIVIVLVSSNIETTECRLNKSHKKDKRRNLFFFVGRKFVKLFFHGKLCFVKIS